MGSPKVSLPTLMTLTGMVLTCIVKLREKIPNKTVYFIAKKITKS